MEYLQGGRENQIVRIKNTVQRPAGVWSPVVHALLRHVHAQGFHNVPEPLGFDGQGHEIVTFIEGEVSNYPLSAAAASEEALTSAAALLRGYHDATVSFLATQLDNYAWFLPARAPAEVICHGDFAPYNVVLNGRHAIAIIDFDTAHPAPRLWDVAYAVYRWAPLTISADAPAGANHLEEQIRRGRLFCDHYGLSSAQRQQLVPTAVERLHALVHFMHVGAQNGNEAFQANIADGHDRLYLADIEYLQAHQAEITNGLD